MVRIPSQRTNSTFWHKRLCQVALFLSLLITGLFGFGAILANSPTNNVFVPLPAAIAAAATAIYSLLACTIVKEKFLYLASLVNYIILSITIALLVILSGQIQSPYLILWMLISIFAGLFGPIGLGLIATAANSLLVYSVFLQPQKTILDNLILFLISLEVPVIVSYIIWHDKAPDQSKKSNAFNALEQQLSQVANKSEIVINAIADGVVAIDANGVIQLINPAGQSMLGWSKQDAVGLDYKSVIKLTDKNDQEILPENSPFQLVLNSNKALLNNNLMLTTISGKKIWVSLVASPVGNSIPPTGVIAVFRDITHEKQEEREKAEFISTASHEMRTPVAAIEGYLGLALNPATANIDDKARSFLIKAHESTLHLGALFQDLLTVSKTEDGRLYPKPNVVEIVDFMREVTESFLPKSIMKKLDLSFKPGGKEGSGLENSLRIVTPVYYSLIDSGHLREIANNLIENAIKYTHAGKIIVNVSGDTDNITISIADSGVGIPPEDIKHLFQKFYRIDNTDTREIGGTGLGLYISRRLVEANNGQIWVESSYGHGSTFFVKIPRISHEKATELLAKIPIIPKL